MLSFVRILLIGAVFICPADATDLNTQLLNTLQGITALLYEEDESSTGLADCSEIKEAGEKTISGIYRLKTPPYLVDDAIAGVAPRLWYAYCDMDFGGTVIYRHHSEDSVTMANTDNVFDGTGHLLDDHWLGLNAIEALTNAGHMGLHATARLKDGTTLTSTYERFRLDLSDRRRASFRVEGYKDIGDNDLGDPLTFHSEYGERYDLEKRKQIAKLLECLLFQHELKALEWDIVEISLFRRLEKEDKDKEENTKKEEEESEKKVEEKQKSAATEKSQKSVEKDAKKTKSAGVNAKKTKQVKPTKTASKVKSKAK